MISDSPADLAEARRPVSGQEEEAGTFGAVDPHDIVRRDSDLRQREARQVGALLDRADDLGMAGLPAVRADGLGHPDPGPGAGDLDPDVAARAVDRGDQAGL